MIILFVLAIHTDYFIILFLRQGFMQLRLASNSLSSQGWASTSCLHLLRAALGSIHHPLLPTPTHSPHLHLCGAGLHTRFASALLAEPPYPQPTVWVLISGGG